MDAWDRGVIWLAGRLSDYYQIDPETALTLIRSSLRRGEMVGDTLADADLMRSVPDGDDIREAWWLTNGVIARGGKG